MPVCSKNSMIQPYYMQWNRTITVLSHAIFAVYAQTAPQKLGSCLLILAESVRTCTIQLRRVQIPAHNSGTLLTDPDFSATI